MTNDTHCGSPGEGARSSRHLLLHPGESNHIVQFYDDEPALTGAVSDFLSAGLVAGESVVLIVTETHRQVFSQSLLAMGCDLVRARQRGQFTILDARQTLAQFMVGDMPDWDRFSAIVGEVLDRCRAGSSQPRIRAFGEMVDLLWRDGNQRAAIRLEEMWNRLGSTHSFSLLCAYVMGNFYKEPESAGLQDICRVHTHTIPAESYSQLQAEIGHRKEVEAALRDSLMELRRTEEALRQSQRDLNDFVENAAEGLHWIGPDGIVLWANRAELELLGCAREEYVGHHMAEFHVDPGGMEEMLIRLARNETLQDYECRLRCKDGSIKHVLIHSNALFRDGKFIHARGFTRDITERKRVEEERRLAGLERESLIEELSRTIQFSEMFVGMLGHDLRNPLSAISTAASHLLRRVGDDKITRSAGRILSSSERMARMIDQLLDFTRLRVGRGLPLQPRPTDLEQVCRLALEELDNARQGREVRFETHGDTSGIWDADRLGQMASNLLANAFHHGTKEDPVTVCLDGKGAETMQLEIGNGGVVPPDILPIIFEPFRSSANRKESGSSGLGLGLFISKQIVLAHVGSLDVRSSSTEGTHFTVTIPRRTSTPTRPLFAA